MSDNVNASTMQKIGMSKEERDREERLQNIQLEALGFKRRDRVSTAGDGNNNTHFEQERIERSRQVNKAGTVAFVKAQENQGMLSGWNNAWKSLTADPSTEMLDSLDDGQSHRKNMISKLAESGHNPDGSNRGGRGGGSGRGGGVTGTRGQTSSRPLETRTTATSTVFGTQRATGQFEISGPRLPISFAIPRQGSTANTITQQFKENRNTNPPLGLGGKASSQSRSQQTAGPRSQPQRPRGASGAPSRGTAAAPGLRRGSNQSPNPTVDYESRLASPEAFMAAGVRIFSQHAAPSPVTTAPAGSQPLRSASTLPPQAASIRSPPVKLPAPVPVVNLPPVAPSRVTDTTEQSLPSGELTRARGKSVRWKEDNEDGETAQPTPQESIFGAQVDEAPVGTAPLYTPHSKESYSRSAEAKASYLDDLLGLDIEPDLPVRETEDGKAGEFSSAENHNLHQQQGGNKDKTNEEDRLRMQKELKNIQYISACIRASGHANEEIIAHFEDRGSVIKQHLGTDTFSPGPKAETSAAVVAANEVDVETTETGGSDEQHHILSERIHKTSYDANSSSQAQAESRPTSKPAFHLKAQASISPVGLPPLPVIDLRASLWHNTVVSLPYRRSGGGRGMWGHLQGEDLIGERVLPGGPDHSQAARLTASAGLQSIDPLVRGPVTPSSNIPVSAALTSEDTSKVETPTSLVSTTVQTLSVPESVATPTLLHTTLAQPHAHQPTITASLPFTTTTERIAEATPSQAKSIARPNITGTVLPNIPDSAVTRQYARSTPLLSPTAGTPIGGQGLTHATEATSVSQLEDSLSQLHITASVRSTQNQPTTANTTLAGSLHQPPGNTQSSRRGATPRLPAFLQNLQNTSALPASGVGSATWLQYNQGPTPTAKDRPASEKGTTSEPPPQTSEDQASGKDAWGRVRRAED